MSNETTYRIKSFRASNVLRLSVVEISPAGAVVTLAGKNAQGKSSVLDAIMLALAGPRAEGFPSEPIRRGADRGVVRLDLGGIVVERTLTAGGDRVEVRTPEGATYKKPQTMLDELFTAISFDPLRFARQGQGEQAETLRRLMGIDLTGIDQERAAAFEQRTQVGRDGKAVKARFEAAPSFPDAPAQPVNVDELMAEFQRRTAGEAEAKRLRDAAATAAIAMRNAEAARDRAAKAIVDLRAEFERRMKAADDAFDEASAVSLAAIEAETVAIAAAAVVPPASADVRAQLNAAEATNRAVQANAARSKLEAELAQARADHDALTKKIADLDQRRADTIAAARFPVPGLSFGEDGVTLDGIPFAQASTAQKIRVSLEVGIALNPRLRVLFVRDGSLLDEDGLALIAKMAAERDCQIWLEDARSTDPTAVVLEDGHVRGAPPPTEAPIEYDGEMHDIKANHVSIDAEGRASVSMIQPEPPSVPTAPPLLPPASTAAAPSGDLFTRTDSGAQVRRIGPPPGAKSGKR